MARSVLVVAQLELERLIPLNVAIVWTGGVVGRDKRKRKTLMDPEGC